MLLLLALGAIPLLADSPAPWVMSEYRGHEEISPRVRNLRLVKEELTFDAGDLFAEKRNAVREVRVVARYQVDAEAATQVPFEFATTVPVEAEARVNGTKVPIEAVDNTEKGRSPDYEYDAGRRVSRFRADLVAGRNVIELAYPHPIGYRFYRPEKRTTYRFVHHVRPLDGFIRSADFSLAVAVRYRDARGWFGRLTERGGHTVMVEGGFPADPATAGMRAQEDSRRQGTFREHPDQGVFDFRPLDAAPGQRTPEGNIETTVSVKGDLPQALRVTME
jgi:hypothetical protein